MAEKTYTDRRMLDVLPWLDKLPDLPLHSENKKATGYRRGALDGDRRLASPTASLLLPSLVLTSHLLSLWRVEKSVY